jgi:hypothetical protein
MSFLLLLFSIVLVQFVLADIKKVELKFDDGQLQTLEDITKIDSLGKSLSPRVVSIDF